ncbi:MAG: histidine kinase dimerization/phosphoacceptor domain -containing protein [Methanomicrobiales archaeon]
MTFILNTPETTLFLNVILSLTIVAISLWGYYRLGGPTPLYFGAAYLFFTLSHLILLSGYGTFLETILILVRTLGYILVAVGLFALLKDIIEQKKAKEALMESEEYINVMFEQTSFGIVEFFTNDTIDRCNRKFAEIFGCTQGELVSRSIWDIIPSYDKLLHFEDINGVLQGVLQEYSGEILITRSDHSLVWCQISLSAVRSETGKSKYFILVLKDIAEHKRIAEELSLLNAGLEGRIAERTRELEWANSALLAENQQRSLAEEKLKCSLLEKEILIKEIHHRVKNNLQVIISLLSVQAKNTEDPRSESALLDSQTRVKSMAIVHEKLYQSDSLSSIDFHGYLQNLIGNLMITYGIDQTRVRITIAVNELPLAINTAIPLGLIMNELVSNSLKYAFPGGQSGNLSVSSTVYENSIVVNVRDDGQGIPASLDWKHAESLGLHLVQMLTRQLKGTVELSRENGTEFTLTIPLAQRGGVV